jgi:hypothetical protein
MVNMDAEREKEDKKEDELEDVDDRTLPELPTSSNSICMDRPRAGRAVEGGEEDDDDTCWAVGTMVASSHTANDVLVVSLAGGGLPSRIIRCMASLTAPPSCQRTMRACS